MATLDLPTSDAIDLAFLQLLRIAGVFNPPVGFSLMTAVNAVLGGSLPNLAALTVTGAASLGSLGVTGASALAAVSASGAAQLNSSLALNRVTHGVTGNIANTEAIAALTAGGLTMTLPTGSSAGQVIVIKDEAGAATAAPDTIDAPAGGHIDGAATKSIAANYGSLRLYCDATGLNWFTF